MTKGSEKPTIDTPLNPERRKTLNCLAAWTGAAVVWTLVGGVPRTLGATTLGKVAATPKGAFTFVQISDTHIGFHKEANPDVVGSLRRAIAHQCAAAVTGAGRAYRRCQPSVQA